MRWKLQPGGAVSLPRWAPDGLHIAYRAGRTLRIVYGNGEHDVARGPRHGRGRTRLAAEHAAHGRVGGHATAR